MKAFIQSLIAIQLSSMIHSSVALAEKSPCSIKESIVSEYYLWKKGYQKFLLEYEDLNTSKRFTFSKDAIKNVLLKIQSLSADTLIPLPESTVAHAKELVTEVEAGRIAKSIANPIMKSSLKKLEDSMDEMIDKAQWKNPTCNLDSKNSRNAGL